MFLTVVDTRNSIRHFSQYQIWNYNHTLYTYNYEYQYECILEQISLEIFHHSFFRNLLVHFWPLLSIITVVINSSVIFDRCYQLLPLLSTVVSIINLEEYGPIYTVLYCNVLYSTVLYCTILYRTIMYRTVLYFKYFASKVPSSPSHPHLLPPTYRPIHRYPFSWRIYFNHHSDNFINK